MGCVVRYMASIILLIFLGIQAVSHSQYYPTSNASYQFSSTGASSQVSGDHKRYFSSRNLHPSYRQHQHHYHQSNDPLGGTTVHYGIPLEPFQTTYTRPEVEDLRLPNSENWESAAYRRRFNGRTTTEYVSAEYPPQQLNQFETHGIDFAIRDNGEMDIHIRDRDGKQVIRLPVQPGRRGYQFGTPSHDVGSIERPPDTLVVVIHRPSSSVSNTGKASSSSSSCPGSDLYGYRRFWKDRRCYLITSKAPCGTNMEFYAEADNRIYGDCGCVAQNGYNVTRPFVFWEPHDACYALYSRGPCGYNEWLIEDSGTPRCAPRKCPQNFPDREWDPEFWFLHEGKCYKTGYHYPKICKRGEQSKKVWFPLRSKVPGCFLTREEVLPRTLLAPVNNLPCQEGYKKLQNGECKRIVRFDNDY